MWWLLIEPVLHAPSRCALRLAAARLEAGSRGWGLACAAKARTYFNQPDLEPGEGLRALRICLLFSKPFGKLSR